MWSESPISRPMWKLAGAAAAIVLAWPAPGSHARAQTREQVQQREPAAALSELAWYDRAGKRLSVLGERADFGSLELSPDGKQLGVAVLDPANGGSRSLWLYDVGRGSRSRLTADPADENWLIWSPDGKQVIFNSQRRGGLDLFQGSSRAPAAERV